jgi:flagellar biosynthesis protein FlhB
MIKIVSAILIALVISMLVLKLILWFLKRNSHFFDEMLKERNEEGLNKYSQGRVYLFLSICAYFIAISIVEFKAIFPGKASIEINTMDFAMQKLEFLLTALFLYVFGGKAMGPLNTFLSNRSTALNNIANGANPSKTNQSDSKKDEKQILKD